MSETLTCVVCGKAVKVNHYGKTVKKGKKMGYSNLRAYTCSKCRGVNTPKRPKQPLPGDADEKPRDPQITESQDNKQAAQQDQTSEPNIV